MAATFEIKTTVERSPWNGVMSTGANDVRVVDDEDDDIRQPKSSSSLLTSVADMDVETSGSGRRRCAPVSVSPGATLGISFPAAMTVASDLQRVECQPLSSSIDDESSLSEKAQGDAQQSAVAGDDQISSPVEQSPPTRLNSEKHDHPFAILPSTVSAVKSSPSTSIGFSIARILSDSIGSSRVNSAYATQQLEARSPPRSSLNPSHAIAPADGNLCRTAGDWASRRRSSSPDAVRAEAISSAALPVVAPFDLCRSQTVHSELDSGRHRNSPMKPSTARPAVILSPPTLARQHCTAEDQPSSRRKQPESNEGCSDNDDEFQEDIDDTDNDDDIDDEQSDDRSMPLDFDVDEDDLKKAPGVAVIAADDRNRDVDGLCRRRQISIVDKVQRLVDLPDCTPGLEQLTWLQCTRYKPPKLPRSKKLKDGSKKRKLGRNPRVPFTQHQVTVLEHKFHRTHYLSSVDVAELSAALNLTENRVKIWFQNRRARERRNKDSIQSLDTADGVPNVGSLHQSPVEGDKTRNSSSTSPSSPSLPVQQAPNGFFFRDPASAAAAAAAAVAAVAAAGYPEAVVRQFNSSARNEGSRSDFFTSPTAAASRMSWPYPMLPTTAARQLPVGLRVPGGSGFAADLLAHLSSSSVTSAAAATTNNVIVGLPGSARISAFSPLQGFLR